MRAFKRWFDQSLAAQAALIFVLGVGVTALFRPDEHPVVWIIQAMLYTAIAMTIVAVQRRKAGRAAGTDAQGVAELHRKIRHREVPSEPQERASMRRLVAEQLGQMERARKWLPYWLGSMALIAVAMLGLGAATGSLATPLIVAVGLIGFCGWVLWMRHRSLDRCRYMRSSLQS
ncbi:hypothetical protein [Streptomyces sp. NPDC051214]|uniref:hypothetical protein n=1 Tax=Streptomyces sp. NPDC051214 TaxID=3155282 RepID=UPI00342EBFEB